MILTNKPPYIPHEVCLKLCVLNKQTSRMIDKILQGLILNYTTPTENAFCVCIYINLTLSGLQKKAMSVFLGVDFQ